MAKLELLRQQRERAKVFFAALLLASTTFSSHRPFLSAQVELAQREQARREAEARFKAEAAAMAREAALAKDRRSMEQEVRAFTE